MRYPLINRRIDYQIIIFEYLNKKIALKWVNDCSANMNQITEKRNNFIFDSKTKKKKRCEFPLNFYSFQSSVDLWKKKKHIIFAQRNWNVKKTIWQWNRVRNEAMCGSMCIEECVLCHNCMVLFSYVYRHIVTVTAKPITNNTSTFNK